MFGIGFFEILVVFLVAVVLLDYKQLKEYMCIVKILYQRICDIKKDFTGYIYSLDETRSILGDDGKVYKAYKLDKKKQANDSIDTGC